MSIISYSYFDPTSTDQPTSKASYPEIPAWECTLGADGFYNQTEDFYFRSMDSSTSQIPSQPYGSNNPTIGEIDYTVNPENKEFWGRFLWKGQAEARTYSSTDFKLIEFWNFNGTRWKLISDLAINNASIRQCVYSTTEGSNAVVTTNTVVTTLSGIISDVAYNHKILDVRFLLDTIAGYIQLYNYTGTLIAEFLGTTTNTIQPTHIAVYNMLRGNHWNPIFAIAADEPTTGMFVVPLLAKSEGEEQDQDVGGSYTAFAKRMSQPGNFGTVSLTASQGVSKNYTYKPKSMADVNLPANYSVKDVKVSAIFEAQASKIDPVNVNIRLRKPTTDATYSQAVDPIYPNVTAAVNHLHQVRHARFKTNPISGEAWQVTDFADIEFGFGFTGA